MKTAYIYRFTGRSILVLGLLTALSNSLAAPAIPRTMQLTIQNNCTTPVSVSIDNNIDDENVGTYILDPVGTYKNEGGATDRRTFTHISKDDTEYYTVSYPGGGSCTMNYPVDTERKFLDAFISRCNEKAPVVTCFFSDH